MAEEDGGISRRKIIGYGWIAATTVIVGELSGGTFAYLWPKVRGEKAERLLIPGKVEDFQVGKMAIFRKEKVFINRMGEGLLAMSAICTHLRCIVRWNGQKEIFECPCHGAVFNAVSEVLAGPPPRPLDIHPVQIVGGESCCGHEQGHPTKKIRSFSISIDMRKLLRHSLPGDPIGLLGA